MQTYPGHRAIFRHNVIDKSMIGLGIYPNVLPWHMLQFSEILSMDFVSEIQTAVVERTLSILSS